MGKCRERRKADFDQCEHSDSSSRRNHNDSSDEITVVVALADVFMTDAVVAKLLARDGAQIERHRQAYEYGEDMVRVVLRPRYDGGYNVEDGRHRVIAAKQAGIGMIEAKIIEAKLIGC